MTMKAIFKLISLPAVLLAASCAQELPSDPNENPGDLKDVVLEVSMPDTPMTRTVLGDKEDGSYQVFWQEGDIISLNGSLSSAVTADGEGDDSFAFYIKASSMSAPYTVLYPGNENNQIVFRTEQEYIPGTFAANTLPMYAQVNSLYSEVSLDYLASVLRIPIRLTSATSFNRIEVTAPEGEPLCGTFSIENGTLAGVETSDKVSYTFGEEGTAFAAGEAVFHIVVPAGTYAGGLELRFYDTEGNYMIAYAFGEDKTIVAGKVYEFAERTFFPDGKVFLISTPADMQTFATKSGESHTLLEARLTADIDMSGVEYNSDSFNFYGTLDGAGNSITGLTTSLFNNLYGTVRNLEITANVEYSSIGENSQTGNNNPYGVGLLAHYAYSEFEGQSIENVTVNGSLSVGGFANSNNYNIGGIVGATNGVPVMNCTNNASITVDGLTAEETTRVGGIAGAVQTAETACLENCRNTGGITLRNNSHTSHLYLGGIAGYLNTSANILECTNDAPISVSGATCSHFIGGILGEKAKEEKAEIVDCTNTAKGTITVEGAAHAQPMYLAGIVAGCRGWSSGVPVVSGCKNYAAITNNCLGTSYTDDSSPAITIGGVIGRITDGKVNVISCENEGNITNNCPSLHEADADVNPGIRLGGIIGYTHQGTDNCSGNINKGNITNTASSTNFINLGGVIGYVQATYTMSSCSNQGVVSNSGNAASDIALGGVVGRSNNQATLTKCINGLSGNTTLGKVSNTGVSATSAPNTQIGGIMGFGDDKIIINAGGEDKSINYAPVSDTSGSDYPAGGGIMGYTNGASDLSNVRNEGAIVVSGDLAQAYVGGVLGRTNANMTMNYASNAGDLEISDVTLSESFCLGGVLGQQYKGNTTEKTYEGLENSGKLTAKSISSSSTSFSYIGGVVGSSDGTNKTFKNCINTGDIDARTSVMPVKCRVGGIAGICNRNPEGSSCEAEIRFKSSKGGCHVGGIAGYLNVAEYKDLTFKGTVFTNGTDGTNYIGGLVGDGKNTSVTFTGCTVSGLVHGANNATGSGLFYSTETTGVSYTFTDCTIGSGSVRRYNNNTSNDVVLTSLDQISVGILVGGKASAGYSSSGWSIVDPDTITID